MNILPAKRILLTMPGITNKIKGNSFKYEAITQAALLWDTFLAARFLCTII